MAECKIERPAPQQLFNRIRDQFSTTVLGGSKVIPESNEWYVVSLDYALHEQFYSFSEQQWNERDPRINCCENLVNMAEIDGIYPRPALFASGYIKLTGVAGSPILQAIEVAFGDNRYVAATVVPPEIGIDGTATIRMRALEPGSASNTPADGPEGTLVTPMAGVDNVVTVYGGQFCGGLEAEECEEFRERYLSRMRYVPNFGVEKIKRKVLEWPCVTSVCVRSGSCCDVERDMNGQPIDCSREIRLYAIFDGTFDCGLAPQCVVDEITEWLFGQTQGVGEGEADWGMFGRIYTAEPANVIVKIDGLACATPTQTMEIERRITEFARRICPSQTMFSRDLLVIVSQVMGSVENFEVMIDPATPEDAENIIVTPCGDAEPRCDYKICVQSINFVNPNATRQGICG